MELHLIVFFIAWLLAGGYVLTNELIMRKVKSLQPEIYSRYAHLDSMSRSMFIIHLVGGENPDQEILESHDSIARLIVISRALFGMVLISIIAYFVVIIQFT